MGIARRRCCSDSAVMKTRRPRTLGGPFPHRKISASYQSEEKISNL